MNLVPQFVLEKEEQGQNNGRFSAVCLFADISGFSTVTNTLVVHGSEAAELMADIMLAIFEPLVDAVYAQGGFITTFAGDAFTALFAFDADAPPAYERALATAVAIQQHLVTHPVQETEYGRFPFSVKLGLADGTVEWGILASDQDDIPAAYYFRGGAVDGAAGAEHQAQPGNIILTTAGGEAIADLAQTMPVGEQHVRLLTVTGALPAAQPLPAVETAPGQARFIPRAILDKQSQGEFRQVVTLFVNLMGIHTAEDLALFLQAVFTLQAEYGGFLARVDFGDKGANLLLFWGMPISHEDDIDRALNFIYDLADVTPGSYKAGLTYRPMYAGLAGSTRRGEYTAYGGGVSYAARLMVKASWGTVWLDERLVNRMSQHFVTEAKGTHTFKGFADPQPVYSLVERQKVDLATFYQEEMVGRQAELAQLQRFVAPLRDETAGERFAGILTVEGEAGLGKSRLVTEFFVNPAYTVADSCQIFIAQTDQTVQTPLNPFR